MLNLIIELFSDARWSPYLAGFMIGLLNCCIYFMLSKPMGCSTAFVRISGKIEKSIFGKYVLHKPYYKLFEPVFNKDVTFIMGIMIGAFLSAILSGTFTLTYNPALWVSIFGDSYAIRFSAAFFGGILMGLGSRWAGGCTSGHGISGTMQMAVSGWLAVFSFFVSGIITAAVLYKAMP